MSAVLPDDLRLLATEREFQAAVVTLAQLKGWRLFHDFDSRKNTAGFPDLILLRGDVLLVAELKAEKGRCADEQAEWLEAFDAVKRKLVRVWKPRDWEEIERTLGGVA